MILTKGFLSKIAIFLFLLSQVNIVFAQNAPVAIIDTNTADFNTTLTVGAPGLLANDTDADNDTLTITQFNVGGTTYNAGETANLPFGDLTINANGSYEFIPAVDYSGSIQSINYTITDGTNTSSALFVLNVEPYNFFTVNINTTLTINAPGLLGLTANSSNTITQYIINGTTFAVNVPVTLAQGNLTINSDGSFTFVPNLGFSGSLPIITYSIFDGVNTVDDELTLVVDDVSGDLLEISVSSCNQGYISPSTDFPNGAYRIRYDINVINRSIAIDYNPSSILTNIDLIDDLNNAFGIGCVISVENPTAPPTPLGAVRTSSPIDFINNSYPEDWDISQSNNPINTDFENITSSSIFTANTIADAVLYPRQSITFSFCVNVDPSCAGSGPVDFDNIISADYRQGNVAINEDVIGYRITDFHTSATTVAANLFVNNLTADNVSDPAVAPNGEYPFSNRVIIKNDGLAIANNVNFNMGLGNFLDIPPPNTVNFQSITVTQINTGGPSVTINGLYNGDTETLLLSGINSLGPGETIILEISFVVDPLESSDNVSVFSQLETSMTLGIADAQGEVEVPPNVPIPPPIVPVNEVLDKRRYSYVIWDDLSVNGIHLDRYYKATTDTEEPSSDNQCQCDTLGMRFTYNFDLEIVKTATITNATPNGVVENEEITFEFAIKNNHPLLQVENLQITDDLTNICGGNIVSVSTPTIVSTTAFVQPTMNLTFDGQTNFELFERDLPANIGSGILKPNQEVVVQIVVVFQDDCIGDNIANFSVTDPQNVNTGNLNSNSVHISVFSDTDNDGITNVNDIDDDNDGILDTVEYNGIDPLGDADGDFIPNYRDTNSGANPDTNSDGIVDVFDFDFDGIPNHFDLDSDNDGITDIIEAGGIDTDNDGSVPVNTDGTLTIDTDNDGLTDDFVVDTDADGVADQPVDIDVVGGVLIPTPNTDTTGNPDYLDIDSDDDGIVDNIEAQPTADYDAPNVSSDINGLVYSEGITPTDTDLDNQPDYLDTNSDNDVRDDIIEGWDTDNDGIAETNVVIPNDSDNDGLDDAYDIVVNDGAQVNSSNNQTPLGFPNEDIPITDERDWRELKAPVLTIEDAEEDEGTTLNFLVYLDVVSQTDIVIEFTVEDIETTVIKDYAFATPIITYTIPAGTGLITDNPNLSFDIETINDRINEIDTETFILKANVVSQNTENLNLSNIGGIRDLDPVPLLLISDPIVVEGNKLEFVLSLVGLDPIDNEIRPIADYRPINLNMFTTNDTARQPEDYLPISTVIIIPAESKTTVVDIFTLDDNLVELTETMTLTGIINPLITANTDVRIEGIGTILDNDLPNLFSPNNDGLSDFFEIIALLNFPDFKLQIFDRWGSEVYNYSNQGNPIPVWWDGNYKGNPAPEGVYYYTLDYNDGLTKPKSGFVQLIR